MAKEPKLELPPVHTRGAVISPCNLYRYSLWRLWGTGQNPLLAIGLNPSKADQDIDDHTINKLMGYAARWGHDGLVVVNLFAYRATYPEDMKKAADPVGPDNDAWLRAECEKAGKILACWGADGTFKDRDKEVRAMGLGVLYSFGNTSTGQPPHPARLAWSKPCEIWQPG